MGSAHGWWFNQQFLTEQTTQLKVSRPGPSPKVQLLSLLSENATSTLSNSWIKRPGDRDPCEHLRRRSHHTCCSTQCLHLVRLENPRHKPPLLCISPRFSNACRSSSSLSSGAGSLLDCPRRSRWKRGLFVHIANHASQAGVRWRVVPADGDLVEIEGGLCVVRWIVRAWTCSFRQAMDAKPLCLQLLLLAHSALASHNPYSLETWTWAWATQEKISDSVTARARDWMRLRGRCAFLESVLFTLLPSVAGRFDPSFKHWIESKIRAIGLGSTQTNSSICCHSAKSAAHGTSPSSITVWVFLSSNATTLLLVRLLLRLAMLGGAEGSAAFLNSCAVIWMMWIAALLRYPSVFLSRIPIWLYRSPFHALWQSWCHVPCSSGQQIFNWEALKTSFLVHLSRIDAYPFSTELRRASLAFPRACCSFEVPLRLPLHKKESRSREQVEMVLHVTPCLLFDEGIWVVINRNTSAIAKDMDVLHALFFKQILCVHSFRKKVKML